MATKKQQKAEQRVTTALTTPEWVRFSDDVVDQIIGEVGLPYQTSLVDGKESENEINVRYRLLMILGERLRRLILRERLRPKLRGFAYDYFYEALSTDPPTSDFFENIVRRSQDLLQALEVQTKGGKKFLYPRALYMLSLGGCTAIEDSVFPAHLEVRKDDETRFSDLQKTLASAIDAIQTLEISARYAGKKAKLKNKTSSLRTDGRMNEDDEILFRLALIYSQCWNRKIGYSTNPLTDQIGGPFVRFYVAVLRAFDEYPTPKAISSRIDRLKKAGMFDAINSQIANPQVA